MTSYNFSEFTDEEIRDQLQYLGFKNVSQDKFSQFKRDLQKLIQQEISMNSTANSSCYESSFREAAEAAPVPATASVAADQGADQEALDKKPLASRAGPVAAVKNNKRVTFPSDSQIVVNSTPVHQQHDETDNDGDESMRSFVSESSSVVDNKLIKRKIRRKAPVNQCEEAADDSRLVAQLDNMRLAQEADDEHLNDTLRDEEVSPREDDEHYHELTTHSDDEQFVRINNEYAPVNFPLKSFIRTQSSLSLRSDVSRASVRSNPVQRYQAYQQSWNKHKVPGEKKHNDLRWSIREQMLVKHVIVKKQPKSYVPNNYVIPTEKKRQQLRWVIRSALANPS